MERVKTIRLQPFPDSLNYHLSTWPWKKITKNNINTAGKWLLQYIKDVTALLSQITDYREKKHRVALTSST